MLAAELPGAADLARDRRACRLRDVARHPDGLVERGLRQLDERRLILRRPGPAKLADSFREAAERRAEAQLEPRLVGRRRRLELLLSSEMSSAFTPAASSSALPRKKTAAACSADIPAGLIVRSSRAALPPPPPPPPALTPPAAAAPRLAGGNLSKN